MIARVMKSLEAGPLLTSYKQARPCIRTSRGSTRARSSRLASFQEVQLAPEESSQRRPLQSLRHPSPPLCPPLPRSPIVCRAGGPTKSTDCSLKVFAFTSGIGAQSRSISGRGPALRSGATPRSTTCGSKGSRAAPVHTPAERRTKS